MDRRGTRIPFGGARVLRLVALAGALAAAVPATAAAEAPRSDDERLVRACTPELVYSFRPGREMDARGAGTAFAPNLRYTDANGNQRPSTTATIEWVGRARVDEPEHETGVRPDIGGHLELVLQTAAGERLTYAATCIAAAGGFAGGLVLFANGIVRGWPGAEARRALVHFEAYTDGTTYVALIDGSDCNLNRPRVVTDPPYAKGTASFTGLPPRFVFAETDCAHRFGEPFPAERAPSQGES